MSRASSIWVLVTLLGFAGFSSVADDNSRIKAVYHIDEGVDQAAFAMSNVRNHLKADPMAIIVVVANGPGIDFLLEGAKDQRGNPFDATVQDLASQGVQFRVCAATLTARSISKSQVLEEADDVPSGVAEIARLQAIENFSYLKP